MNQNSSKFNFEEFGIQDSKPAVVKKAHYIDETSTKKIHSIIPVDLINFGIINEDIKPLETKKFDDIFSFGDS